MILFSLAKLAHMKISKTAGIAIGTSFLPLQFKSSHH
jgi:hypothetical protein